MNKLFFIIYTLMGYYFSITLKFDNPIENILGIFVCIAFSNFINEILYIIAFEITGCFTSRLDGYSYRSSVHWGIRIVLMAAVMIVAKTGLYESILTPYTHHLFTQLTEYFKNTSLAPDFELSLYK